MGKSWTPSVWRDAALAALSAQEEAEAQEAAQARAEREHAARIALQHLLQPFVGIITLEQIDARTKSLGTDADAPARASYAPDDDFVFSCTVGGPHAPELLCHARCCVKGCGEVAEYNRVGHALLLGNPVARNLVSLGRIVLHVTSNAPCYCGRHREVPLNQEDERRTRENEASAIRRRFGTPEDRSSP